MEHKRLESNKTKKLKRKEILEKKKTINDIIRSASSAKDHLSFFPPFCRYDRNGLSAYLESGSGEQLSNPMKLYMQNLLKVNMEGPYGPEWSAEEKVKRREMVSPEARYIFVRHSPKVISIEISSVIEKRLSHLPWTGDGDPIVGFVHYRFVLEEEIPVVYVYELQLDPFVQGRGLGKFLMQLIELIARKSHMGAVMLTVQKANFSAMNFYQRKLRYSVSSISPSRVDPLLGIEKNYEILCKTFEPEARSNLEE